MKYKLLSIIFILIQMISQAQPDSTFFNSFLVLFNDNFMSVEDDTKTLIYKHEFSKPFHYLTDIDEDGFDELIIVDSIINFNRLTFYIYFFNGKEEFKLADSIYSGTYYPFLTFAEEISKIIIQTGNPDFELFNLDNEFSALPINIWKYKDDKLILINDEVYEPFLFENENLIRLIDFYLTERPDDCSYIQKFRGIIASAFTNYINAGEHSLAEQFFSRYYPCSDRQDFKQQIIDLIFPQAK